MIPAFLLSPAGRWLAAGALALAVVGGAYTKGYFNGRAAYKAKIERQISDAVKKGTEARDNSLRELDAGRVPDEWFRD